MKTNFSPLRFELKKRMTYNIIAYLIYALISIFTISYVGRTLHRNGRHFVLQIIPDDVFCDYINNGLLAGYYLVNIGYVLFTLTSWQVIENMPQLFEIISLKTGGIYLMLGVLHFFNIAALRLYARYNPIDSSVSDSLKGF